MVWGIETCIKLIGEYKKRPVLWNPRHTSYYCREAKETAWREVAEELGKEIDEVKKKMESLKGSYRREKGRMKKRAIRGKGRNEYTSHWFGYKHFSFLDDKNDAIMTSSQLQSPSDEEDPLFETQDAKLKNDELHDEEIMLTEISDKVSKGYKVLKKRPIKRKTDDEDPRISRAFSYLKEALSAAKQKKDQCGLFGEYLADKMRSFDAHTRAVAQHRISNILFELEMETFNHSETSNGQSSVPIHSFQGNLYQSPAPKSQIKTEFEHSDQFHPTSISTSYSEPTSHLSNFKQQIIRPSTSQPSSNESSRSSTSKNQQGLPYPSSPEIFRFS